MAIEIEHKFLLVNDDWRYQAYKSLHYRQGYLHSDSHNSIRIRVSDTDAWLNIKSATIGTQRDEYEYAISLIDANEMLNNLCRKPLIEKTRHFVKFEEHIWEIDEFEGDNQGLIVAEVELTTLHEQFALPLWVGKEVTEDLRYYNNKLAITPYTTWDE